MRHNIDMYILASQLHKLPIMSLQTGKVVGVTRAPIIDMAKLEVMAFHCQANQLHQPSVLLIQDIRQISRDALIIDSFEDFSDPQDIVRLQPVLQDHFSPIGARVIDQQNRRLGKVEDYTLNIKTGLLQKLYVHQSLLRSMLFNNTMIDRTQIIEVKPKLFVVHDTMTPQLLHTTKTSPKTVSSRP